MADRAPSSGGKRSPLGFEMLAEMQRIAQLRLEQQRAGGPTVTCGYCSWPTRYQHGVGDQHISCECCGAQMVLETLKNASGTAVGVQVRPITDGWRSHKARREGRRRE